MIQVVVRQVIQVVQVAPVSSARGHPQLWQRTQMSAEAEPEDPRLSLESPWLREVGPTRPGTERNTVTPPHLTFFADFRREPRRPG